MRLPSKDVLIAEITMNGLSLRVSSAKSDELSKKVTQDKLEIEIEEDLPEGLFIFFV